MKQNIANSAPLKDIELYVNKVRLVALTFGINLYTDQPLTKIGDAVLSVWKAFRELVPGSELKFYATENMSEHKPVKKGTLQLLETWLAPKASRRDYIVLEMKSSDTANAAPDRKFQVWGDEEGSDFFEDNDAKLVSMAFPPDWGFERSAELKAFFISACERFPFTSGQAGFQFEFSPYQAEMAETHAWKKSMRHRGIDINYPENDKMAIGFDGVKGVNWLTAVSDKLLRKSGGRDTEAPEGVTIILVRGGLIFQAGDEPRLGDQNRKDFLPEYVAVYNLLKPLIERAIKRSKALELEDDENFEEKSRQWMRRLAK